MAVVSIILRLYQPSDFEVLYRIDRTCFPPNIAYGRSEMKFYLDSEGSHCLLAEVGGNIAGFILTARSGDTGHVITLDVLEPYRRQQVGSRLLRTGEQEAAKRGARRMVLETATTNKPAIAFWNKHGYGEFGTLKDYYGRGLDAFEMRKSLMEPAE
jgi:[ribosomal protein S18]-alanine N-acetyltransferase